MRASALARTVEAPLEGGSDPDITGAAPLDHAGPADLSLLSSARYLPEALASRAGAILVSASLADRLIGDTPRIVVPDVHAALALVLPLLYPPQPPETGIHPTAVIDEGATLGVGASLGPYVVVGADSAIADGVVLSAGCVIGRRCRIGAGAYLHASVTLYDDVTVGARSILHAGVRVGVDGFGYTHQDGHHRKIPQVGSCVIGSDVEIGANSCIDRGSIGATVIADGCKIDNLVHIGHNVQIGEHSVIVAQAGIAGSTRTGRYVTLGGQAGINGHIYIGDGARVAAQSGVFGDVAAGETVSGYPARPHREALRAQAAVFRLPTLWQRVKALERRVLGKDAAEP